MPIEPPSSPSWRAATGAPAVNLAPAPLPPLRELLAADLRANAHGLPPGTGPGWWLRALVATVPTMRFLALVLLRCAQVAGRRQRLLGSLLKQLNHLVCGCDIAWEADIGPGLILFHPTGVVVGPAARLGPHCALTGNVTLGAVAGRSPSVGADVYIGPGAAVLGGVTVGDHVIIAANAVVVKDVESGVVVGGVPAGVISRRTPA